jgi:adhesin/invasin
VQVADPYTGQPDVGATVTFSDGSKGGVFNPTSAVTDSSGDVSTTYTVPKKAGTYNLTASGTGFGNATITATATTGSAIKVIAFGGAKQTGVAGSTLANPLVAQAQDVYKNGVAGITVTFTANKGGIPNPASAVTDANGQARTMLQLPPTVGTITVTGSATGFKNISYVEYSVAGPAATIAVTGGNNQTAKAGTQLPTALTILVTDQYGNPVSGNSVMFSDGGAGGTFSGPNPAVSETGGMASEMYTLPVSPKTVTIDATATGVTSPAVFHETGQ